MENTSKQKTPLNSPLLEGCPQDGVAKNDDKVIQATINSIPIYRNFVENLPYNHNLKRLVKEKRKAGILGEVLFWMQVHKRVFYNIDFDRQRIIGNYIIDFYVKTLGLVVEIDGSSHEDKVEYDRIREEYLVSLGLRVYRIKDSDVKTNLGQVMRELEEYIVKEYGKA
jgi:very-short-patch-repair endonuclease